MWVGLLGGVVGLRLIKKMIALYDYETLVLLTGIVLPCGLSRVQGWLQIAEKTWS